MLQTRGDKQCRGAGRSRSNGAMPRGLCAHARRSHTHALKIIKIMCLYPKFVKNPKYKPNKKNGFNPPICAEDKLETLYVPIACGECIECRKQKAREWQIRLSNELSESNKAYFVTLTFSENSLTELKKKLNIGEANAIAGYAVRHFLERWRKQYKKTLRHWLITELGHTGTERIHLHGLIFTNEEFNNDILQQYWQYGYCDTGKYVNQRTINYIIKYVTKVDNDHKLFKAQIFCSAGIGRNWMHSYAAQSRRGSQIEYMTLPNGHKVNIPIYYRNKLWSDEEREKLWIQRVREGKRFVMGIECDLTTDAGRDAYNKLLECKQAENIALGYGEPREWYEEKKEYNTTLCKLNKAKRTKIERNHNVN